MEENQQHKINNRKKGLRPAQIIIIGFASIIAVGSFLLWLPISSASGEFTSYIDALFTATSAVCVTGLTTVSVGYNFSIFGQVIILLLIQAGGLGFMTVSTLVMILFGKKIMFRERIILQSALGSDSNRGLLKLVTAIMIMTIIIQACGVLLLLPVFLIDYGAIGIWYAIFLSISAFCNAGFDVFGSSATDFPSLSAYVDNAYVTLVIAALIIIGGMGFAVINDLIKNKFKFKKLSLHSRIVINVTGFLIIVGWIFFFISEYSNEATLGNATIGTKVLASFFQSVTSRTAGFSSIDSASLTAPSKIFTMILMFIGASPGSTGGGIKTTTFALLLLAAVAGLRGKDSLVIRKRTVKLATVFRAYALSFMALMLVLTLTVVLLATQDAVFVGDDASILTIANVLFDSVSAFSTTGLSTGITPLLSVSGKIAVIITMFLGRVGLIPFGLFFVSDSKSDIITYPEEAVPVG